MAWTNPVSSVSYLTTWADAPLNGTSTTPVDNANLQAMQQSTQNYTVAVATSLSAYTDTSVAAEAAIRISTLAQETTARTNADLLLAPKVSPTFTGTVTVPTPTSGDSSSSPANTAWVRTFVASAIAAIGSGSTTAPTISATPTISGTTAVGSMLAAIVGTVTGSPTPTISYQWNRNGTPITTGTGYNAANYLLQSADVGDAITVTVTASNSAGSASSTSAATAAITAATASLHVNTTGGVAQVLTAAGTPFLALGESVWGMLSDTGTTTTANTDGGMFPSGFGVKAYSEMSTTVAQLNGKNVNLLRFRVLASYYNGLTSAQQTTYIGQVVAWANAWTSTPGNYFMPTMWDGQDGSYAGSALSTSYTQLGPLIVALCAALNGNAQVLHNPVNEPYGLTVSGGDNGFGSWQTIFTWVVNQYRTAGYRGILVIDPPNYANSGGQSGEAALGYNDTAYTAIETADASALGSAQHQIVFSKHDYANEYPSSTWSLANWQAAVGGAGMTKHAIMETEIGFENGTASTESIAWNIAALQSFATLQASMPNFCGVVGFLEAWIDDNSMTTLGTFNTATAWGTDFETYYLQAAGGGSAAVSAPVFSAAPSISGTTTVGSVLAASSGTASGSPSYAYQWKRAGTAISGATSATYTLASADVGDVITVTVTASNSAGSASSTSAPTTAISAPTAPAPTSSIAGFTSAAFGTAPGSTIANNVATVPYNNSYDSGVATVNPYSLVGSSISVNVQGTAGNGTKGLNFGLALTADEYDISGVSNSVSFNISGGTVYANCYTGSTRTGAVGPTVPATIDIWLRIREASGTVYWDTSPDGTNWTNLWSTPDPFSMASLYASCGADIYGTETASNAYFSNLNGVGTVHSGGGGGSGQIYFPSSDPFNWAIQTAWSTTNGSSGTDANSSGYMSKLVTASSNASVSTDAGYGYPIYYATTSDPHVTKTGTAGYDSTAYTFYWPTSAIANTGSDGHMIILQPDGVTAIDIYEGSGSGSSGTAGGISSYNISTSGGSSILPGAHCFGSRAAGLALLGGTILGSEYAAGVIPHALAFACTQNGSGQRAPATHNDGGNDGISGGILEGMRFQLNPGYDISGLASNIQPIALAMQTYGFFDVDSGSGGIEIFGESYATASNLPSAGFSLSSIPWSQCRLLANSVNP
jgi:flagellar basal body L-ring protein FlgH